MVRWYSSQSFRSQVALLSSARAPKRSVKSCAGCRKCLLLAHAGLLRCSIEFPSMTKSAPTEGTHKFVPRNFRMLSQPHVASMRTKHCRAFQEEERLCFQYIWILGKILTINIHLRNKAGFSSPPRHRLTWNSFKKRTYYWTSHVISESFLSYCIPCSHVTLHKTVIPA